jgi:hypothetical protein
MVGGLIAANSSTILSHLNWGASYLVHDFYRRFLRPKESEHHYVQAGRIATLLLFVLSSGLVFVLQTAQESFNLILQVGAGTGLIYLLRWFWWRVTAWCEIVAMVASFGISVVFLFVRRSGVALGSDRELVLTVVFVTICWLITAFVGPQTDRETLIAFYRKTHPSGPGWKRVAEWAGTAVEIAGADNIPLSITGWVAGVSLIWSSLFTVGNFLYGRTGYGWGLLAVAVASAALLISVVKRLWD